MIERLGCPFDPNRNSSDNQRRSCRRVGCKYFESCPSGKEVLKPEDEEKLIYPPSPDTRAGERAKWDRPS